VLVRGVNASMRWGALPTVAGAVIALVGVLATLPARAEDSCRSRCWDAYGSCYKSTSNRQRCQAQLLRCLSNCIRAKRSPASLGQAATRSASAVGRLEELLSWSTCVNLASAVKRRVLAGAGRL
jgi:hypothetical protein